MYPILFRFPEFIPLIGGHGLHTYGLMIALAFLLGWNYTLKESKKLGINEERMSDFFFYMILWAMIGARVLYIINSVDDFWSDPFLVFRVWEGGLVFQGGVIFALFFVIYYSQKHKLNLFQITDIFAVPLALGHGLGRLGCFFAGCCYGKPCGLDFPLGVVFPDIPDTVAPTGIPLYPTQLFEAFAEIIVFFVLFRFRRSKPFDGAVFLLYMMIYAVLRSIVEVFRGDGIRGFIVEPYFSVAQFISALFFIFALATWVYLQKQTTKKEKR